MCQFGFKPVVLCSLMAVVVADQYVHEYTRNYSCRDPLPIILKEHCEETWSCNGKTIAVIRGSRKECVTPCQKDGDNLKIPNCVDFTSHIVCKNGDFSSEERIHFIAQRFQSSQIRPQPQGLVGLLLVAFLIIRSFTN